MPPDNPENTTTNFGFISFIFEIIDRFLKSLSFK